MKHMRRFTALVLALVMVFGLTVTASAAATETVTVKLSPNITVTLDGEAQAMTDVKGNPVYPVLYGGTTYLPVRAVGNMLGLDVGWNQATQTVLLTTSDSKKPGTPGSNAPANAKPTDITVTINPNIRVKLDGKVQQMTNVNGDPVYPMLYGGTTYLPIRAVSRMLKLTTDWDGATQTVELGTLIIDTISLRNEDDTETIVDLSDAETARRLLKAHGWADEFIERAVNGPRDVRSIDKLFDDIDRANGNPSYYDTHDHTRTYTAPNGRKITFDAADPDWSRDVLAAAGFSKDEIDQIMLDMTGRDYNKGGQTSPDAAVLGDRHIGNDWAEIDWSTANDGYVRVRVDGDVAGKTRCEVICYTGSTTYDYTAGYDLAETNGWCNIPLSHVEGEHECVVAINYASDFDDKLQTRFTAQIDVPDSVWLMSNVEIDYKNAPNACAKAKELTRNCKTDAEKITAIYNFVSQTLTYDDVNGLNVGLNPDSILSSKRGVCQHYAMLMTTMLRSIGIPCKYVIGSVDFGDGWGGHAWVVVKPETGTLNIPGMGKDHTRLDLDENDNLVAADPTGWIRLDPTNARSSKTSNDNIYSTTEYK